MRELCDEFDVFLVFDEVAMGMGRSGHMFACERERVTPDLLCLAKGLTGGYLPVAATLASQAIFDCFLGPPDEGRTFFHGHTFTGNALGCAVAIATLDIFQNENVVAGLPAKVDKLTTELDRLWAFDNVGDIRQYGLAVGVELVRDRQTKASFDAAQRRGMRVCRRARDAGVFLRPLGDVLVLMPPLSITPEEIERLVDAVCHGLEAEFG